MSEAVHIISLGAGVQSSTMALKAAHGEFTPMPLRGVFADTGDEPVAVYKWLDWLEKELPFPIERVSAGKLSDAILRLRKSKKSGKLYFDTGLPIKLIKPNGEPALGMRQCTGKFKIDPINASIKQFKKQGVIMWIGISYDEVHRMKQSKKPWITNHYPLVFSRTTREQCLEWMAEKGYPTPPRSACDYCPYHSSDYWRQLKTNLPERFAEIVQLERKLQGVYRTSTAWDGSVPFLHESRVPIDEVDFDAEAEKEALKDARSRAQFEFKFGNECEGMCGV